MKRRNTYLSIAIAFLIIALIPSLSCYSSTAGRFVAENFSSFVHKIGANGELTGVFLSLFCAVLAFLISITIIVVIFIVPIWQGINNIKKGILPQLTPSILVMYFFSILVLGFFVSFTFRIIDTLKNIMR